MKKIYALISFLFLAIFTNAAVITVTAGNFAFSPAIVTVQCGDTVLWNWVSGTHTTTSSTIPICATAWTANLSATSTSHMEQIPCAGTYNYGCSIHPNMTGQIICICTSGINGASDLHAFKIGPNPFTGSVKVNHENAEMLHVYNVLGSLVKSHSLSNASGSSEVDLSGLLPGVYFFNISREGILSETRKLVKE